MSPNPEKTFVQAPEVELRTVGEDVFLVASEAGGIHHLNPLGARPRRHPRPFGPPFSCEQTCALAHRSADLSERGADAGKPRPGKP